MEGQLALFEVKTTTEATYLVAAQPEQDEAMPGYLTWQDYDSVISQD